MARSLADKIQEDERRPATWRRIGFWTLVLVIASFWIPTVPIAGESATPFTATNMMVLGACVVLAVLLKPGRWSVRLGIGAALVGLTLLAWFLAEPIRQWLGGAWAS